jgi:glycosyltransferase involved in cell wall biosynthesis
MLNGAAKPQRAGQLSLSMMVKNEERNLAACLDSVRGLADELIVVDTGSTDRTPSLAAAYGAEVIRFDFSSVDFAAARNCAIAPAAVGS